MTGFGTGEAVVDGITTIVEIKTVNNRYCDIKVKMPLLSLDILQRIENIIQKSIKRGTVNVLVKIDSGCDHINEIRLNEALLKSYLQSLARLKDIAQLEEKINLADLLRCREIFELVKTEEEEKKWESIRIALNKALYLLLQSREEEGNKLMEDIQKSIAKMKKLLKEIEIEKRGCLQEYREKLLERIKQLAQTVSLDEGRLEMETAFLVQKSDITEEIARLKSHFSQLKRITGNKLPIGRKLEFYTQEIGREINTIGAKSITQSIGRKVIRLKDELEKVKEQARNIE